MRARHAGGKYYRAAEVFGLRRFSGSCRLSHRARFRDAAAAHVRGLPNSRRGAAAAGAQKPPLLENLRCQCL